jgi:cytochrome c biogenesis protein CcmG/thiol:disulfide interchange protein DsbE
MAAVAAVGLAALGTAWAGVNVDQQADDFTLSPALGGKPVSLSQFKGKPTVVVFWATWCPPCRREVPILKELHQKYSPKGLQMLAVAVSFRETRDQVVQFANDYELPYTVLWDQDNAVSEHYGVQGIPTVLFIDPQGVIRFRSHSVDGTFATLVEKYTGAN